MRKGRNPNFISDDDVIADGICLGFDFVAEHEWGINKLQKMFGIDSRKNGVDGITCTLFPQPIVKEFSFSRTEHSKDENGEEKKSVKKHKGLCVLVGIQNNSVEYVEKDCKSMADFPRMFNMYNIDDNPLATAWDDRSFGITAYDDEIEHLRQVLKIWDDKDMTISCTGKGLVVMRKSKIPEEVCKEMLEKDIEYEKLMKAVKKTRIEEILKKAGKSYYALSPDWISEEGAKKSKYPVWFFLNPEHQNRYHFGWFTVEELKFWAKDKGPIIIEK